MTDCVICLNKNGKIYRELGCGHRLHHKCLLLCETTTCPLCRTPYDNMVLRKRVLSNDDKLKLKIYCNDIKSLINKFHLISETDPLSERLHIINTILKYIIYHKYMLTGKFPLKKFIETIKHKINCFDREIIENGQKLTKSVVTQYKQYSKNIINFFDKC
jgi:hypothetical protein